MRRAIITLLTLLGIGGCAAGPEYLDSSNCPPPETVVCPQTSPAETVVTQPPAYANPVFLPVVDHEAAWEQTVDMLDDYFRIEREEPIRVLGNEATEGNLTTLPEVSPTIFEPWRHDTGDHEQRVENTLQTMRRRAVVRLIPAQGGHWVDVQVYKELEDLPQPAHARAGKATLRYDDTLTRIDNPIGGETPSAGWIPRGRDTTLEQRMIGDLLSRCGQTGMPAPAIQTQPQPCSY